MKKYNVMDRPLYLPVGKQVGPKIYFHRQYSHLFPEIQDRLAKAKDLARSGLDGYIGLRWDTETLDLAFQWSPNFDTADEPILSKSLLFKASSAIRISNSTMGNELLWHHKWLWVQDDYEGFDVEASKAHSRLWLPHVTDAERRKIGRPKFWNSIKHRWEKDSGEVKDT